MTRRAAPPARDFAHIHDLFAHFAPVTVRRLFGGAGVYADGLMFAIVVDDVIYLKVAPDAAAAFEREGLSPFGYETKSGRNVIKSFWQMPERLYDEPEELARWAADALAAARAVAATPARKRRTAASR